jgi:hypothetical protein
VDPNRSFLKRLCLYLAIALTALIAVGPFLHAHYGKSYIKGFHIDGIHHVASQHGDYSTASFQPLPEQESDAIGVTTSYSRQLELEPTDVQPELLAVVWVMYFAAVHAVLSKRRKRLNTREIFGSYSSGFPPPSHAPPFCQI